MIITRPLSIKQPEASNLIREMRAHIGLTQEQLALHLGVTYSTMNRWENRRGNPSPLAIQKIEAILLQMGNRGRELLKKYASD
jgi:transcriptional regulator with XRE-family HTH domain